MRIEEVKPNKIYRHFKGNYYRVLAVSHSTDNPKDLCVVYQSLDGYDTVWSRPIEEFASPVPEKSARENVTGQSCRFEEIKNLNVPLREASTENLIRELMSRKDLYDYDFNGDKSEHFSEYVYGPKLYVTEENPLGIEIRGYTDDASMLKKCLRVNDIVYKRVYIPVDMADLTETE